MRHRTGLRNQLALICLTDFLVWLGSGAIYPYLPVFLREDAGASLGMIGLVAGAYYVAVLGFSVPAGRLSDRVGRKPMLVAGTAVYALSMLLFALTKDPWLFVLFRAIEGLGAAAVVPAAMAFVAEISSEEYRSRAYGWLTSAQYAGLIIGPAAAWALLSLGSGGDQGFRAVFFFGSAITAAAAVTLAVSVREPDKPGWSPRNALPRPPLMALLSRPVAAIILIVATAEFAIGGFEVVWSIYLRDLGASLAVIGLSWVLFSAPLLLSFLGGRLADRHSRLALMVAGFSVQAVCWLLVPIFHDPAVFLLIVPVDGLALALAFPAKQAFLVQVSPPPWLGTIQGMEQSGMQFAALIGTIVAPLLYAWLGAGFFAVAGAVGLGGLLVGTPVLRRTWLTLRDAGSAASVSSTESESPLDG